jgi:hypothetical protein
MSDASQSPCGPSLSSARILGVGVNRPGFPEVARTGSTGRRLEWNFGAWAPAARPGRAAVRSRDFGPGPSQGGGQLSQR